MDRILMKRYRDGLAVAFGLSAAMTCVLVEVWPGSIPYRFTKVIPLLILSLARFRDANDHTSKFVGFGLLASFLGDVVIDSSFVLGLGAFLLGHLFYVVALGFPARSIASFLALVPALAFGVAMYWLLVYSGRAPEDLRIPVTIYMCAISTMFGRALSRAFVEEKNRTAWIFLFGAVFFVISDSMIGLRRWVFTIPHASVLIMFTYYVGQWGIYWGSKDPAKAH